MSSAGWTVETLDAEVDAEIEELPPFLRARFFRLLEMIETIGLDRLREPHVKHIEGKLWEVRAKSAEGIARGIVCDGNRTLRSRLACICEEVAEDPFQGFASGT